MKLLVPIDVAKDDENFINFIISIVPDVISIRFNNGKALAFDKKVDEANLYNVKFDTRSIIFTGVRHLEYRKEKDGFRIFIREHIPIIRYNQDLDSLCRFINYGNTEITGYSIISDVFTEISKNINRYKSIYDANY